MAIDSMRHSSSWAPVPFQPRPSVRATIVSVLALLLVTRCRRAEVELPNPADADASPRDAEPFRDTSGTDREVGASERGDSRSDAFIEDAVPLSCGPAHEPPNGSTNCDAIGVQVCKEWAIREADGGPALGSCVFVPGGITAAQCVRADRCPEIRDISKCTCGGGPRCEPGQMCANVSPRPRCQCINPP
jgi:hypothetical protein